MANDHRTTGWGHLGNYLPKSKGLIVQADLTATLIGEDEFIGDLTFEDILSGEIISDSDDIVDGYYRATENFKNIENKCYPGSPDDFNKVTVGTSGEDIPWVDAWNDVGVTEIIDEVGGHKNVLKISGGSGLNFTAASHKPMLP